MVRAVALQSSKTAILLLMFSKLLSLTHNSQMITFHCFFLSSFFRSYFFFLSFLHSVLLSYSFFFIQLSLFTIDCPFYRPLTKSPKNGLNSINQPLSIQPIFTYFYSQEFKQKPKCFLPVNIE